MSDGQQWDALPEDLVNDLAQLTKANSIEGSRQRPAGSFGRQGTRNPEADSL